MPTNVILAREAASGMTEYIYPKTTATIVEYSTTMSVKAKIDSMIYAGAGTVGGAALSAEKLATPRTINDVEFDGTKNITITANPNSHAHGNITNAGAITATSVAIATGDALAITDASASNVITKTSITFDTAKTTTYLRQDGTWVVPPNDKYTHPNSGVSAAAYGSTTAIPILTIDAQGHITKASTAAPNDTTKLPLAGGTMTGHITFNSTSHIKYASGSRTGDPIQFFPGDVNGSGIVIGDGGRVIIGGGESATALRGVLGTTTTDDAKEELHLGSDSNIYIHTNCNTVADRKTITINTAGNINAPGGFTGNLTGNASTASKLTPGATINGVKFDGSGPIIITATPTAHDHAVTTANAAGFAPKLNNDATYYLNGKGAWAVPPTGPNDNYWHETGTWSGLTYTAKAVGSPGALAFTIPTGTSATTVALGNHTHNGYAASSHAHGNITSAGAIGADTAKASGQHLVMTDATSNAVIRSNITIGTATTTYLRNDGTWATPTDHTYTVATKTAAGLMPALNGDTGYYLNGNGAWSIPPNTTYSVSGNGISMSASNVISLSIGTGATQVAAGNHTHSYAATNHTHGVASTTAAGFCPTLSNNAGQYLNGQGKWTVPPRNSTFTLLWTNSSPSSAITNSYPACPAGVGYIKFFAITGCMNVNRVQSQICYKLNTNLSTASNEALNTFTLCYRINDGKGLRVGGYARNFGYDYNRQSVAIGDCARCFVNGNDNENSWLVPLLLFGIE